jgi:two-component system response regulator MprA
MVVDDETAVCDMLTEVVRYSGHDVVAVARDGVEAVDAARKHRPDVVVMDVLMPRMNGVQAMREIVAKGTARKVLLISGEYRSLGMSREQILQEGAAAFLEKPFGVGELADQLDRWASEINPPETHGISSP